MTATNDRRMQILFVLIHRKSDTMKHLASEFGVSRMTIFRDIQVLSCSHPITTSLGGAGGVSIDENYHLGMRYLSEPQRALLVRLSESLTGEDAAIMQSILRSFTLQGRS